MVGSYTNKQDETKTLRHAIRFIDSFKFISTTLEKLVDNLPKDAFVNVRKYYTKDKISLLTRKGVYPYDYMDSPDKLKELNYHQKKRFTLGLMTKVLEMKITFTRKRCGKPSI